MHSKKDEEARLRSLISSVLEEGAGLCAPQINYATLHARVHAVCLGFSDRPLLTPLELLAHAHGKGYNKEFRQSVLEGFLTRDTLFFRDKDNFRSLQKWLEKYASFTPSNQHIKIWAPACASGQEALSIAMLWHKLQQDKYNKDAKLEIFASDISTRSIAKAKIGKYNNFDAQCGLAIGDLLNFFDRQTDFGLWQAKRFLFDNIKFFEHNLLHSPPSFLPRKLDWIFVPHTLRDFVENTATRVITRLASLLSPHGWLALSPSEAEIGFRAGFKESEAAHKQGLFARSTFSYPDHSQSNSLLFDNTIYAASLEA